MHSLKGLLNLPNAAKKLKWSVFTQAIQSNGITAFESIIEFVNILKNLISAHREENWKGHLQAIQDMIPVFCQT